MVHPEDEVYAITSAGGVIRTSAAEIKISGRQTMGVRLVNLGEGQSLVAIARNAEATAADTVVADDADADADSGELADTVGAGAGAIGDEVDDPTDGAGDEPEDFESD